MCGWTPNSNKSFFKQDWLPTKKMLFFFFFLLGGIFCPTDQKGGGDAKKLPSSDVDATIFPVRKRSKGRKPKKVEKPKRSSDRKGEKLKGTKWSKQRNGHQFLGGEI